MIPGGSSVPALSPDQIDVPLDYDSLGALGTFFGAASLIVVDDRCCMVQLALRVDQVLHARVVRQVHAVPRGDALDGADPRAARGGRRGSHGDIELLRSVGSRILGKSLCALGDFAVYPVASYIEKWGEEFARTSSSALPVRRRVDARGHRRAERRHAHSTARCRVTPLAGLAGSSDRRACEPSLRLRHMPTLRWQPPVGAR